MPLENMPVMKGINIKSIPMYLLAPYERQAERNHYQSLYRLAERGGMASHEILAIIRGLSGREIRIRPDDEAELIKWVERQSEANGTHIAAPASVSPAITRNNPAADLLNPLNPISPLNPINQIDSYEPPRSHSPCESSSSNSGHYSSSSCSSSSSSEYSSSSSSNSGSSCSSD